MCKDCDAEKANYGSGAYCAKCGMDLGLNPLKKQGRQGIKYFCCSDCLHA